MSKLFLVCALLKEIDLRGYPFLCKNSAFDTCLRGEILESEQSKEIIKRIFPEYFNRFELPAGAHDEMIKVYRACRSGKCDKDSFLPSFEENGYVLNPLSDPRDPSEYSLSTYEKPNHIKRYASMISDMEVPYTIAIGYTNPKHGPIQRTCERKSKSGSHVDWWLYEHATPYEEFEIIPDFEEHLEEYIKERDAKK